MENVKKLKDNKDFESLFEKDEQYVMTFSDFAQNTDKNKVSLYTGIVQCNIGRMTVKEMLFDPKCPDNLTRLSLASFQVTVPS